MYTHIVTNFRPQKEDPNRVRITAGGNLIKTPWDLTTIKADLTTPKIQWKSIIGTDNTKCAGFDISKYYLGTEMERYAYVKMQIYRF